MKTSTLSKRFKTFLVCIGVLPLLLISNVTQAGTKTLEFEWEQVIPQDFKEWVLYVRQDTSGSGVLGNYTVLATIPYSGVEVPVYMESIDKDSPDGTEITYFFVMTAKDIDGNESGASNEVSARLDFLSPDNPLNVKVTVRPPV